jgi:hypothetical protein
MVSHHQDLKKIALGKKFAFNLPDKTQAPAAMASDHHCAKPLPFPQAA